MLALPLLSWGQVTYPLCEMGWPWLVLVPAPGAVAAAKFTHRAFSMAPGTSSTPQAELFACRAALKDALVFLLGPAVPGLGVLLLLIKPRSLSGLQSAECHDGPNQSTVMFSEHLFMPLSEHLCCARHCSRHWGYTGDQNRQNPCPDGGCWGR